jgi:hypothetical protein
MNVMCPKFPALLICHIAPAYESPFMLCLTTQKSVLPKSCISDKLGSEPANGANHGTT